MKAWDQDIAVLIVRLPFPVRVFAGIIAVTIGVHRIGHAQAVESTLEPAVVSQRNLAESEGISD